MDQENLLQQARLMGIVKMVAPVMFVLIGVFVLSDAMAFDFPDWAIWAVLAFAVADYFVLDYLQKRLIAQAKLED